LDVAGAALAEGAVLARDDTRDPEMAGEQLADEGFGRSAGQRVVELEYQHGVGAGGGEQLFALVERGEAERRHVRREMAHRVRIERRDEGRPAFAPCPRHRLGNDLLVAEVEPVEVAERDDRAAQMVGDGIAVAEPRQACRSLAPGAALSNVTKAYAGSMPS